MDDRQPVRVRAGEVAHLSAGAPVGCQDQRFAGAVGDQSVEVVGRRGSQLAHAEVVQDRDGWPGELGEPLVPGPVGPAAGEVGEGTAGFREPGPGSGPDREVGEGLSDVALADADGAVALGPGSLVHLQHRTDEHVPRAGQHHDERPHDPELAGHRVEPAAELPVVDLRLLPGLGRPRVPHRHCARRTSSGMFAAT
jgi:hypothetical protein